MTHIAGRPICRCMVATLLTVSFLVASAMGALAQGASPVVPASPVASVPPSPCIAAASSDCLATPTPQPWPLVQFLGGNAVPVTESSCGVPGVDTFHLTATDGLEVDVVDVVLAPWDPAFVSGGWPGTASGTMTAAGITTACFGTAVAVFDPATGVFQLAACHFVSVPMSAC